MRIAAFLLLIALGGCSAISGTNCVGPPYFKVPVCLPLGD